MPLSSYLVENYRGFANRTEIEVRPLTLFFGYNSAGKSALIRALPLLADSMRGDFVGPLDLSSLAVRGASFADISSRFSPHLSVRLGFGWDDSEHIITRAEFLIRGDFPQRFKQGVEELRVWTDESEPALVARWLETPDIYELKSAAGVSSQPLVFSGLLPESSDVDPHVARLLNELRERLSRLSSPRGIHWLGPWRVPPRRSKDYTQGRTHVGHDGVLAPDILAYDERDKGPLIREVSSWYERATDHRLEVITTGESTAGRFSIVVTPVGASPPVQIPIQDTGEGMTQVLPVLVLGAMARHGILAPGSILAIEHPALHLHPAAHEHLADYFARVSQAESKPRVLLETHSQNLLLGIQRAILDRILPADDVIVYWIRNTASGRAVADPITFNELAEPQGPWPPGVFSEDVAQSREIIRARRNRRES